MYVQGDAQMDRVMFILQSSVSIRLGDFGGQLFQMVLPTVFASCLLITAQATIFNQICECSLVSSVNGVTIALKSFLTIHVEIWSLVDSVR
jgi:hypothetical protein